MKKLLAVLITLGLLLTLVVPVSAADTTVGTSVTVNGSGDAAPVIKCKWEQDTTTSLENGDTTHVVYIGHGGSSNAQFLPPVVKNATKTIVYYAVVTSDTKGGDVSQVFADVFSPLNSPAPYDMPNDPHGPRFKYEVNYAKVPVGLSGSYSNADVNLEVALVNAAFAANLITFSTFSIEDIRIELNKQTAALWKGVANLTYEQPAGDYTVNAVAMVDNAASTIFANTFTYVAVSGVEIDFLNFNYGPVAIGTETMRAGDTVWATSAGTAGYGAASPFGATIRNIGNTWARVLIQQNDMGLGKDSNGNWEVSFDARMGNLTENRVVYFPNIGTPITLPNAMGLSTIDELDLSIKVIKPLSGHTGAYVGTIIVSSSIYPFTADPIIVTGLPN